MLHTYTLSKPEKLVIKNIKNQLNNNKSIQELSIKEYGELSPESNLAEALSLHHGEVVDILIENDALTNSVLTNDSLIHALYANHHKIVEHMIHKPDFNPNYTNDYGCNILMAACSVGNFPVVQFLINTGARINEDKQSPLGEGKALVSACSSEFAKSSIDIVYFLVERGAKVNAYSQGTTPLICASYTKNIELVQFLLCQGADPRAIRETDGATAIMVAAREGNLDILKLLVNESDIHHLDNKSQNTLFYASHSNSPQVVEFLISLYQDAVIGHINAKNTYGLNCLLVACKRGNPDIVNLLINAGADVNSADNYHNNTLIEAVRGRSLGWYKLYLLLA
ncbi:MAG: hypothetical protein EB127_07285 [Alphaproteobacteria bacterium]|nr:hypothetical protein [Alphaproteobacteria bacterium]